ncbi:MAG: HEPN domain-containing protein [Methylococcaceae bacterium]|nr:HEPN domain-containing protein [Methylococcaceae bacterium]
MSSLPNDNFNPVEFYVFAGKLYIQSTNEATYRTVIGRAYYAVHLCAKDYTKIINSSGSVHEEVIKYFKTRNKRVFRQIKDLKDLRNKADYNLIESIQKRDAGESLRLAKDILKALNYLS